jgi:hypothetical protein
LTIILPAVIQSQAKTIRAADHFIPGVFRFSDLHFAFSITPKALANFSPKVASTLGTKTPEALANFSPGLLQPWDRRKQDLNAEGVTRVRRNSFRV